MLPGIVDIFQFSFTFFFLQEFISGYFLFQIKYLKNLAFASILFCTRELFTELPIPGPAHLPPPLLHCFTSEGSSLGEEWNPWQGSPRGLSSPCSSVYSSPLGSKACLIPNSKVFTQSSWLEGVIRKQYDCDPSLIDNCDYVSYLVLT